MNSMKNARELFVFECNDKIYSVEIVTQIKKPAPLQNKMKIVSEDDYSQEIEMPEGMFPERVPLLEQTIKFTVNDQAEMNSLTVIMGPEEYSSLLNFLMKTTNRPLHY